MDSRIIFRSLLAVSIVLAMFSCKKSDDSGSGTTGTVPTLQIDNVAGITKTSAWAEGRITSNGGLAVKSKGICWNTAGNPTTNDHMKLAETLASNFALLMDNLSPGTTYHVRLFARNDAGTGYSEEKIFKTLSDTSWLDVTTLQPDFVGLNYARVGGQVNDSGYSAVTERGICWGSMSLPTVADNKIACGSGLGSFSAELQGLTMNSRYHYRAYAYNAQGLVYGDTVGFTTNSLPLLFVPGNYQGWNPADSSTVVWSVKDNGLYEGYLWFPANTQYKYTRGNTMTENYGDNNQDGTLELNGASIEAAAEGYYKLNVDLPNLTHALMKTSWSVIGTATSGAWSVDTDLSWDPVNKVWTASVALTTGEIKFRSNHSWELNYGDNEGDGTLEAGGDVIAVSSAGTYVITLNFNGPHYRYTLVK